ncbi:hypothetical protein [Aquiflexum sp.]|uniref:hypothetical protein n=1 Tax=Aquiflexum sp. TaxID=1872584 RepID=UPI0035941540
MKSKKEKTQKYNTENPFANANTTEGRGKIWDSLRKLAKPISKEDFLRRLKEAGA